MTDAGERTAFDTQLLQRSLTATCKKGNALSTSFYRTLFSRYPEIRPPFNRIITRDSKEELLPLIILAIYNLEKPKIQNRYLERIRSVLVANGAQAVHIDAVGECLLEALSNTFGPSWTYDVAKAWTDACAAIVNLLKRDHSPAP